MSKHSVEDILGSIENEAHLVRNAISMSVVTGSIGSTEQDNNGNRYTVRRVQQGSSKAWRVTEATELTLLGMVFMNVPVPA